MAYDDDYKPLWRNYGLLLANALTLVYGAADRAWASKCLSPNGFLLIEWL